MSTVQVRFSVRYLKNLYKSSYDRLLNSYQNCSALFKKQYAKAILQRAGRGKTVPDEAGLAFIKNFQ